MKIYSRLLVGFAALLLYPVGQATAQSPWLPGEGNKSVFFDYTYEEIPEYWKGSALRPNIDRNGRFNHLTQQTFTFGYEQGLSDELALDVSVGYTRLNAGGGVGLANGMDDTRVGIRYALIDEFAEDAGDWTPTVTWFSRLTMPGSYPEEGYDTHFCSAGDKAWGFENGFRLGKVINDWFGVYGSLSYAVKEGGQPEEINSSFGMYGSITDRLTFTADIGHQHALGGPDFFGPGWSKASTARSKERFTNVVGGLNYFFESGLALSLRYGETIDGENTGKKDPLVASTISYSFR